MSRYFYSAKELADDTPEEEDENEQLIANQFSEPNFFEKAKQAAKDGGEYLLLHRRVQMMEKIFASVMSRKPFPQLVDSLLGALMDAVDSSTGSIFELDHNKNEFFFRAIRGDAAERVKDFRIPRNSGVVGEVAETREAKLLNNIQTESKKHLHSVGVVGGFEAKHCIAVPILISGEIFGVAEIFNKKGDELFTQDDFELVKHGVWMAAKILEIRFLMAELVK